MQRPIDREDLSHIAHLFKSTRIRLNLDISDVAGEAGFKNLRAASQHLRQIEKAKPVSNELYQRFAPVLGIDVSELKASIARRREERRTIIPIDLPPRHLGTVLERARMAANLTFSELPEDLNIHERRLRSLESGHDRFPTAMEFAALAHTFSIPIETLKTARHREHAHYDDLTEEPKFIVRAMAAIYVTSSLPENADTALAVEYAQTCSARHNLSACLVFPDKRSVYFYPSCERVESFKPPLARIRK